MPTSLVHDVLNAEKSATVPLYLLWHNALILYLTVLCKDTLLKNVNRCRKGKGVEYCYEDSDVKLLSSASHFQANFLLGLLMSLVRNISPNGIENIFIIILEVLVEKLKFLNPFQNYCVMISQTNIWDSLAW